jgi:hypothetical protein
MKRVKEREEEKERRFTCTPTIKSPMSRVKGLEKREIAIPPKTPVISYQYLYSSLFTLYSYRR